MRQRSHIQSPLLIQLSKNPSKTKSKDLTNAEIVGRAIDLLVMAKEMMIVIRTRETLGGGGGEAIGE